MGEGNRVVLPLPLVGHYETETVRSVTFTNPITVSEQDFRQWQDQVAGLLQFPAGEHQVSAQDGSQHHVWVEERTIVHLLVGLADEDSPVTHLATLLQRLKVTAHEIYATVNAPNATWEPEVTQCLLDNGLALEPFGGNMYAGTPSGETPSHVAVPYRFAWRR
jgi:hypothetical protein